MRIPIAAALTIVLAGCSGSAPSTPDARPLLPTDKLDLLFVIDNSESSGELQASLATAFPSFIEELADRFGGVLPDLHLGVVSGNLGAGGFDVFGCDGDGDGGRLQNRPSGACDAPSDLWISDRPDGAGGRARNSLGTLEESFQCISNLGVSGCGYQQHLGALRAALDGRYSAHDGFLREDAVLATITVADDDDCTASDPILFDPAPPADSGLGEPSTGRCTRFGWTCDGQSIPAEAATYTSCEPRGDSYLVDPNDTLAFLERLKSDPRRVVASAIVADRSPAVFQVTDGVTKHANICTEFPHSTNIRDRHVVEQSSGTWINSCDADLRPGLRELANTIADRLAGTPR